MKNVVFLGDSITETMRWHGYEMSYGGGYVVMVAAEYMTRYPGRYNFFNRGKGCDKSDQVLSRVKEDGIDLKPDILSVLMGVNDVWHQLDHGVPYTEELFINSYTSLIGQVRDALPDTKLILMEPYIIKGYATVSTEEQPDRWELFRSGVERRAALTREIAAEYGTEFVPLQQKFDEIAALYGDGHLCYDGAHPTPAGHLLIARSYMEAFDRIENLG